MYKEIENDVNIQCLLQKSRDGVLNNSNYQILDGKLWYKRRLVLPKESRFIPVILRECHDTKMGGYYDVLKTLKRVQQSLTKGFSSMFWNALSFKLTRILHSPLRVFYNLCHCMTVCGMI